MNESTLRDWLADNISLLDPSLTVIKKEYRLDNPDGTTGFIDILCQDRFGSFVVIELKKSNQAARQAIQEFYKYVSLLMRGHGIEAERIRCILVSSEWSELIVPFSYFVDTFDHDVKGYRVLFDKNGSPFELEPIRILDPPKELVLHPRYFVFTFSSSAERDSIRTQALTNAEKLPINLIVASVHFRGLYEVTFAPYLLVLSIAVCPDSSDIRTFIGVSNDWSPDPQEGSTIEGQVLLNLCAQPNRIHRDIEVLYAAHVTTQLTEGAGLLGWHLDCVDSTGPLLRGLGLRSDTDLIQLLGSTENTLEFQTEVALSNKALWKKRKQMALQFSDEFALWKFVLNEAFETVEGLSGVPKISIELFRSQNILLGLWRLYLGKNDFLPTFELLAGHDLQQDCDMYSGLVVWNGCKHSGDLRQLLTASGWNSPNVFELLRPCFPYNAEVMTILGLGFAVLHTRVRAGDVRSTNLLTLDDTMLVTHELDSCRTIHDFLAQHHDLVSAFREVSQSVSMDESTGTKKLRPESSGTVTDKLVIGESEVRPKGKSISLKRKCTWTHSSGNFHIHDLGISSNFEFIAAACDDGAIRLFYPKGDRLAEVVKTNRGAVHSICIAPNGDLMCSGNDDGTIQIWREKGRDTRIVKFHEQPVGAIAIRHDGRRVLSGCCDPTLRRYKKSHQESTICYWDLESSAPLFELSGHESWISGLAFVNDNLAISASWDATLAIWDLETGRCLDKLIGHKQFVTCLAINRRRNEVLSGSADQTIKLWDIASGRCLFTFEDHEFHPTAVCIDEQTNYAFSSTSHGMVRRFDLTQGIITETKALPGCSLAKVPMLYCRDNTLQVLAVARVGDVFLWNVNEKRKT